MSSGNRSTRGNTRTGTSGQTNGTGTNYPYHPFIKMPGQSGAEQPRAPQPSSTARSGGPSMEAAPRHRPQQAPRPRAQASSSRAALTTEPMSLEMWEQASEDIEDIVDDDAVKTVVDRFIETQQAVKELREAIDKTRYRRDLGAGGSAAEDGLIRLHGDLGALVVKLLRKKVPELR